MTRYLYEKFHQDPEMNGVGAAEDGLKEPSEQAQVAPAVLLQLLSIPPRVTYGGVKRAGNGTVAYVNDRCELFIQDKEQGKINTSVSHSVTLKGFTAYPTFRKRFRSLQSTDKIFQRKQE